MLNRSASLAMSTSVLKALAGKLDIKKHSPSILYVQRFFRQNSDQTVQMIEIFAVHRGQLVHYVVYVPIYPFISIQVML